MIVLRDIIFSEKENNKDLISSSLAVGTILGKKAISKGFKKIGDVIPNSRNNSELSNKIKKELIKEAQKRGVNVKKVSNYEGATYTGNFNKNGKKYGVSNKTPYIDKNLPEWKKEILKNIGKNNIILGKGPFSDVDVLSHELGHEYFTNAKTTLKNFIPKYSHKLSYLGKKYRKHSPLVGLSSGIVSGKLEDSEKDKYTKYIPLAYPIVTNSPILISEASASLHGYKQLKRLGADKNIKRLARKRLGAAFGTYAFNSLGNLSLSIGASEIGKIIGRKIKLKKEDDDNFKK